MLFNDLLAIICIGVGHIYLFHLLVGKTKIFGGFVLLQAVFFMTILGIGLSVTGFTELNLLVAFFFLVVLGWMEKRYSLLHIICFALLSIVFFTVIKNGLFALFYELYVDSPFPYYGWTMNVIHLCTMLLILTVLFFIRNFIRAAGDYLIHSKLYIPSFIVATICTGLLFIVNTPTNHWLAKLNIQYGEQLYTIVLIVSLIIMALITMRTYVSKAHLIEKHEEAKRKQFLEYVEKLELLHDELATFRHDYTNILLSLEQSIQQGNMQQVKRIFEQTVAPTATLINHQELELTKLARVETAEIKSVVSMKVLAAQRKALKVQLDIPHAVQYDAMPSAPLIRIASVLLDNAIEEAEQSQGKQLQIALFEIEQTQYVIVKNSTNTPNLNVGQLYAKSHSSKGENRGLGLFSAKRIIEKYPHSTLSTMLEDGVFTQKLIMKQPVTMKSEPFRKKERH